MISKVLLTAWVLAAAAMTAPGVAAAQAQAAATGSFSELMLQQTASDRMNMELDQVVRAAVARGAAERKDMSASQPIQNYLAELQRQTAAFAETAANVASAPATPPTAVDDIPPLVESELMRWELEQAEREALDDITPLAESEMKLWQQRENARDAVRAKVAAYAAAKAKGVAIKVLTAKSIETWGRLVVIVPPGEVIENDPMDVAHARLEDLTRRRDELQAELKTKPTSMAMRSILRELAGIDRQINSVMFQITGVVWFHRAGKGSICHPAAVKGQPVAWHNCDYWAQAVPFVVDPSGANIIVDRVLIDIDEDAGRLRKARIAYYTRASGQAPSEESSGGAIGEFRYAGDGSVQLAVKEVDDAGEERERLYPWEVATDELKGLIPGFSGYGPFKLKFKRDPKAYISWEEADAMSRGVVAVQGGKGAGASTPPPVPEPSSEEDDFLSPLIVPDKPPAPRPSPPPPPPPPPPASEDDFLAPLIVPN
ncbi:MAG: hypothetical protein C0481_19520 [Phenylobacterium sp.]|uniref:hypothetical protein n=1 Tax=Phenylobacterium sp. TaxID=1871053 RepID=UPI0025FCE08D|nr:hypothetical protein [Phenylobacterium sp.]MBA4014058.1 hypothetical protein [Phenylobacterium sp.]